LPLTLRTEWSAGIATIKLVAMNLDKINDAIRQCVEDCRAEGDPIAAAMKCLRELRNNPDWTHEEVAQVKNGVIAILGQN
jgi:hypothetical protein